MFIYSFEKLEVWHLARRHCKLTYELTGSFPVEERFGLIGQMRRAALSIASNLAEGCGKSTKRGKANFYSISYSSALELLNQVIIANDLNFLTEDDYQRWRALIEELTNKISALSRSLNN